MMGSRRLAGTGAALVAVLITGCGGDDNNDTKSSAARPRGHADRDPAGDGSGGREGVDRRQLLQAQGP